MLTKFLTYLAEENLVPPQSRTLLAVSGGVDSIVLVDLFKRAHLNFAISHCHFGLRGQSADDDQNFVHDLSKAYRVPFFTKRFDTTAYAKEHKESIQMAARSLRYTWFAQLLKEHGIDQVATAHHMNDQIETFIYHIVKGTSIAGLHGILAKQPSLIRPLTWATKRDILDYAAAERLLWREDASNASLKYARNLIRHQVIPTLKNINPNLEKTFASTLSRLRGEERILHTYVEKHKKQAFYHQKPYYYINLEKLNPKKHPSIIPYQWLKTFGFSFKPIDTWWKKTPQSGKRQYSSTHWLLADRNHWIIGPRKKQITTHYTLHKTTQQLTLPQYQLHITLHPHTNYPIPRQKHIAALDADKLTFPLQLRLWKPGDTFYPLGMMHKKKISDFLINEKIPLHLKNNLYLLISNHQIVWIIGHRIDHRYRLTPTTKSVYEITLHTQTPSQKIKKA